MCVHFLGGGGGGGGDGVMDNQKQKDPENALN